MRSLLVAVATAGLVGGLGYLAGHALGLWDPSKPIPQAGPERVGWTTREAVGFSLALPDSWRTIGRGQLRAPDVEQENPAFAEYVAQAQRSANSKRKLQAFDLSALSRRTAAGEHFVTNMGVIKSRVEVPAAVLWRRDVESLKGMPNRVGPVRRSRVRIDGRHALKMHTRVRLRVPEGGRVVLSLTQWSIVAGDYEYVLTYATTARAQPAYAATFEKSAESFALVRTSGPRPQGEPFQGRVENACARHIPDLPPPATSYAHAHARARGYARLAQVLRRIDAPRASRANFNKLIAAVDAIAAAEGQMAQAARAGSAQGSYNAVGDVLDAVNPAVGLARRLRLPECAAGLRWTA